MPGGDGQRRDETALPDVWKRGAGTVPVRGQPQVFELPQVPAHDAPVSGLRTGIRQSERGQRWSVRTRGASRRRKYAPSAGRGAAAEVGTLEILGVQQVPGNAVLYIHPEGVINDN